MHADKNLYPGINAHLNSYLQNEPGGWRSFHSLHITDLDRAIDAALPPGYFTRAEKSLQIGEFNPGGGDERTSQTTPDVTVYQSGQASRSPSAVAEVNAPVMTFPISETITDEDELTGLVIYQAGEGSVLGRPVTRVELLSPANKPNGSHHEQYMVKRLETLKSGLRLVEIDYLHQTPPLIQKLPDYSKGAQGAAPYLILVSDPRPTLEQGKTDIYAFGVDDPMPIINVPLAGADVVKVNFGEIYNYTFENSKFFRALVNYAQEPVHFDRYHEADRVLIQKRLEQIRSDAGKGKS